MNWRRRWLALLIGLALPGCSAGISGLGGATVDPLTGLSTASGQQSSLGSQSAQLLQGINTARSQARDCDNDGTIETARPALKWNDRLEAAAAAHTQDVVNNNKPIDTTAHTGSDGSDVGVRVARAGYTAWTAVGENIAAGQNSVQEVIQDWLSSPSHCKAIMDKDFKDIGAAMLPGKPSNTFSAYWTMDFGAR